MLCSCFDLRACTRSIFGNGCILSRFFSLIFTSNKFEFAHTSSTFLPSSFLKESAHIHTYTHTYAHSSNVLSIKLCEYAATDHADGINHLCEKQVWKYNNMCGVCVNNKHNALFEYACCNCVSICVLQLCVNMLAATVCRYACCNYLSNLLQLSVNLLQLSVNILELYVNMLHIFVSILQLFMQVA
jgi:hypothetical protein